MANATAVELFVWQDYYVLGLPELDTQHRRMFEIAGELYVGLVENAKPEVISSFLSELLTSVQLHFQTEEELMRECGYRGFVQHRDEHSHFLEHLRELSTAVERGHLALTPELMREMNDWMTHHLCGSDAVMSPAVRMAV